MDLKNEIFDKAAETHLVVGKDSKLLRLIPIFLEKYPNSYCLPNVEKSRLYDIVHLFFGIKYTSNCQEDNFALSEKFIRDVFLGPGSDYPVGEKAMFETMIIIIKKGEYSYKRILLLATALLAASGMGHDYFKPYVHIVAAQLLSENQRLRQLPTLLKNHMEFNQVEDEVYKAAHSIGELPPINAQEIVNIVFDDTLHHENFSEKTNSVKNLFYKDVLEKLRAANVLRMPRLFALSAALLLLKPGPKKSLIVNDVRSSAIKLLTIHNLLSSIEEPDNDLIIAYISKAFPEHNLAQ